MIRQFVEYLVLLWDRRHFCLHLAMSDVRSRFRRSKVGVAWAGLQPMLLTTIMSFVLAAVFNQPYKEFSIYVFSGILVWDLIVSSINCGAGSLIGGEGYLRQIRLPVALFPIKAVIFCAVFFLCGLAGYIVYVSVVLPSSLSVYFLYLLFVMPVVLLFCLPLAIISAIVNTQFRDYQQLTGLFLQMLWYLSPVFVARNVFESPALAKWTKYNPIAAICDMVRDPLLAHRGPSLEDVTLVALYALLFWIIACVLLIRNERRILFYL